ncbi:hypothetical protein NADFUDRAFT_81942 [Nadsonia fulvescens var. elongata DSM 6958]|uniref:Uncharacterized protein n=1 Tax=Nadsonia fulvescens var. elongata DSM 6958 TaxID=857566 RepID=A0A1E3PPW4_9ASCO|nr:hypothetical protein NADFUDRAFT_81942 [Nadsonia fulvescens var. elongata DSM 6958]
MKASTLISLVLPLVSTAFASAFNGTATSVVISTKTSTLYQTVTVANGDVTVVPVSKLNVATTAADATIAGATLKTGSTGHTHGKDTVASINLNQAGTTSPIPSAKNFGALAISASAANPAAVTVTETVTVNNCHGASATGITPATGSANAIEKADSTVVIYKTSTLYQTLPTATKTFVATNTVTVTNGQGAVITEIPVADTQVITLYVTQTKFITYASTKTPAYTEVTVTPVSTSVGITEALTTSTVTLFNTVTYTYTNTNSNGQENAVTATTTFANEQQVTQFVTITKTHFITMSPTVSTVLAAATADVSSVPQISAVNNGTFSSQNHVKRAYAELAKRSLVYEIQE